MADDEANPSPPFDYKNDPEFLAWLKSQQPDTPTNAPTNRPTPQADDMRSIIRDELGKLKNDNPPQPQAPPIKEVVKEVQVRAKSWFFDE